jgi:hypothetical protein
MYAIQIIAVIFAIWAASRVFLRLREKKLSVLEYVFWMLIWVGLVLVALFPDNISPLAQSIGIQSGTGLVTYTAMIIAFYLLFRLYVKMDTIEQEISTLNREIVLRKARRGRR